MLCNQIKLSKEPDIFKAIKPGALLENVITDEDMVDFDDGTITENTRVSYPIDHIENIEPSEKGGHPRNVIFLVRCIWCFTTYF